MVEKWSLHRHKLLSKFLVPRSSFQKLEQWRSFKECYILHRRDKPDDLCASDSNRNYISSAAQTAKHLFCLTSTDKQDNTVPQKSAELDSAPDIAKTWDLKGCRYQLMVWIPPAAALQYVTRNMTLSHHSTLFLQEWACKF